MFYSDATLSVSQARATLSRIGRPDECLRIVVVLFNVIHDGLDQLANAVEGPTADPLVGDLAKPAFHHVQPRTARRYEVDVKSRMPLEPRLDLGIMDLIDAGDPMSPIGLEPFPNGGRIKTGAYGGTSEASKSYFGEPPCETIAAGDINGDCKVDYEDLAILALHWLQEPNP